MTVSDGLTVASSITAVICLILGPAQAARLPHHVRADALAEYQQRLLPFRRFTTPERRSDLYTDEGLRVRRRTLAYGILGIAFGLVALASFLPG